MILMRELRKRARVVVGPILGIALTAYFAYNLVEGDRGFIAWTRLARQLRAEDARLDALRAQRAALKLKVSDLTPSHLDPDLLDERVRGTLNLVGPNERVIMKPAEDPPTMPQASSGNTPRGPPAR
jgi:cell division protein FtsB